MQEKLYLKNNTNHKISAILSKPAKTNSKSVIIMCHGLNSSKDSLTNVELEKVFLRNNIAVFRFDFFAHGESEGNSENRSVNEFVSNVLKSIEYVKQIGYIHIGVYGASFGGVASVIAASKSHDIEVMALKAAGIGQTSRKMYQYKVDFDAKIWIKAGEKINIPTLIIHGTSDEDVEMELGKELSQSIKNSKFHLYSEANHRFSKKEDFDRMIKDISEFIIKNIGNGKTIEK
jgi:dipeptidyl aminopeptidase/acylaminoacyl peptidase